MAFPGHTLVCKERVCLSGLIYGLLIITMKQNLSSSEFRIWNIDNFNFYSIEIFLINFKKNEIDKNQTFYLLLLKFWNEIKHALKLNQLKNIAKFAKNLFHL